MQYEIKANIKYVLTCKQLWYAVWGRSERKTHDVYSKREIANFYWKLQ